MENGGAIVQHRAQSTVWVPVPLRTGDDLGCLCAYDVLRLAQIGEE